MNDEKTLPPPPGDGQWISEEWGVQWQGCEFGIGNLCLGFCIDKVADDGWRYREWLVTWFPLPFLRLQWSVVVQGEMAG